MPIQTFAFPNYYVIVLAAGIYKVFLLVPNLRFLLSKLGPPAKINLVQMKSGFSTIYCRKSFQRPTEIFLFSKYHCTTLTVELELNVSFCAQLKIFTYKTASNGLILQNLCILGPITRHRLTLKGKFFCITGKSSRKN